MTTSADPDDVERLQRHLRAMSAVNHQLHAQIEGQLVRSVGSTGAHSTDLLGSSDMFGVVVSARRGGAAAPWIEQLQLEGGRSGDLFLARTPRREVFLVEVNMRRAVKAGLLVAALSKIVGPVRSVSEAEINKYREGPPVEVLEASSGPAFVVVGGRRHPIRGLPLPYPVANDTVSMFPVGEELNMSLGAIATSRSPVTRAKQLVAKEGPVQGVTSIARKAVRRARRTVTGATG